MTEKLVRAYRGAITVDRDEETLVVEATQALLTEMLSRNTFDLDDVISVFFTTTPDVTSAFPALATRGIGFADIPLMCASEIAVPHALPRTIRVLLHAYSSQSRHDVNHVYLREATVLRGDLHD